MAALVANQHNALLQLPSEVVLHCLAYLSPLDLTNLCATSQTLRKHALDDRLWQRLVNENLPAPLAYAHPFPSFRQLYHAHHPYWFLTKNQVWISDQNPYGQLVIARYNPSTGNVEAHTVVAEMGVQTHQRWDHDPEIDVIGFDPKVKLHLEAPVLQLQPGSSRGGNCDEISMDCSAHNSPGLRNNFVYCCDYPQDQLTPGSAVWPSMHIPALNRTLNLSASDFTSSAHRPQKTADISQSTFRVRKWVDYHGRRASSNVSRFEAIDRLSAANGLQMFASMNGAPQYGLESDRRGERVTTFGSIDPEAYTPTPLKPWRGIWCGDYSAHGCEFLLVLQLDEKDDFKLPSGLNWLMEWLTGGRRQEAAIHDLTMSRMNQIINEIHQRDNVERNPDDPPDAESVDWLGPDAVEADIAFEPRVVDPEETYTGKLVGFKITGDPYVPKGEISFIAPDLKEGFVRTAQDDLFRGARVVRAAGHLANNGFIFDEYIPSELILVSHDTLAQHWQGFGCISFFRRVDIGALLAAQ